MTLGAKLAIIFVVFALVPLLALSAVSYRSGVGSVEGILRERASERTARVGRKVVHLLEAQNARLLKLSQSDALDAYVRGSQARPSDAAPPEMSAALRDQFGAFVENNRDYLQTVTCLDGTGDVLFRVVLENGAVNFLTKDPKDFGADKPMYDSAVWGLKSPKVLRSPVRNASYGASLLVTAPVLYARGEGDVRAVGAVVAELRLGDVVREADGADKREEAAARTQDAPEQGRSLVAIDNATDDVVYHTNSAYNHTNATSGMPYFASVASRMRSGGGGFDSYEEQDGGRRLVAFRQIEDLGVSLAAAEDYSSAVGPVKRTELLGAAFALVAGMAGLLLLLFIARREQHGIEEVARGASAIAAGNLEQRIDVSRSGETRELADCFNKMSDRLQELISREAETRQFQSFLRISAMISHDLKNAIAGLSMLVANMEKQFHREEFRADAIESLREATEKLKRTVARLSEPAKSLSGEYRIAARQTDLAAIIRRVLDANAYPLQPLYDIEARLPDKLVATVEPERIENVIENLVINGLEAMGSKGGGRLTVEAGTMPNDLVFFSVADTGIGMSEEFKKTRLFRPFSTTKNKGIGLGLFTCKEIVETHGGRLEVDSSPNSGTRFRVVLPSSLFRSGERHRRPEKVTASTSKAERLASE